jgi:hypothetical protein
VIRWGPDASSDKLRAAVRCTSCGGKGATVQHPGWAGNHIGFCPFPTNVSDENALPDSAMSSANLADSNFEMAPNRHGDGLPK